MIVLSRNIYIGGSSMDEIIGDVMEVRVDHSKNSSIKIPTNVKQIGNIESTLQVYLEDFVHSYLKEFSAVDSSIEQVAILVGKYIEQEQEQFLLITGAIRGEHTTIRKGSVVFTEQTWDKIHANKEKYFPDEEIVGWVRSQPGFGVFLSGYDQQFHQTFFKDSFQLVYVIDPVEKTDAFFQWEEGQAKKISGYFIYYDKNTLMHEYMIDNRLVPEKKDKENPENFLRLLRRTEKVKKSQKNYQQKISSLAAFSVTMIVVSGLMGLQLINLQNRFENISSRYEALSLRLENLSKETTAVFNQQASTAKQQQTQTAPAVKNNQPKPVEAPVSNTKPTTVKHTTAPAKKPAAPVVQYTTYTVKKGDTLLGIALRKYGDANMMKKIKQYNAISESNNIRIGQKIKLPVKK